MLTADPSQSTITTIYGFTISGAISMTDPTTPTLHNWSADTSGLFHTTTDLAAEWKGYYQQMLAGQGGSLNDIQRLEGNAEAVFENTGLAKLDAVDQARDREDVQRQYDAMYAAMKLDGLDVTKPLSEQGYLGMEQTIQDNAVLQELGVQGHGLNNSGVSRYNGYTNDFQNNVDQTTLFIGGGILNNNKRALADFFDDNALSHAPFEVVVKNGVLEQLNQNGAAENTMNDAIVALNDSLFNRVYTAADFSPSKGNARTDVLTHATAYTAADKTALAALEQQEAAPAPAGDIRTLFGADISNTMTIHDGNGVTHVWTADSNGLFQTTTNLATEWRNAYIALVTNGGAGLTAEQRLEANAEAVFENTNLSKLSAAVQQRDREDAQRQFDAEFQAMRNAGINTNAPLTNTSYIQMEHSLQGNAALEELALQGHGLNNSGRARYAGYTNDFQTGVDGTTTFNGGGLDNGQNALKNFFDDAVLGHGPFPTVVINGKLVQLNQNAAAEDGIAAAVKGLNRTIFTAIYDAADFKHPVVAGTTIVTAVKPGAAV